MNTLVPQRFAVQSSCLLALLLTMVLAAGCKVGPNYLRPAVPVKEDWLDAGHPKLIGEPQSPEQWWTVFEDQKLDQLVQDAYRENLTLRVAGMRVLESRAQLGIARGLLFPQTQTLNGTFQHTQISQNRPNFFGTFPGFNLTPDDWTNTFAASWELDFWGRYRRAIEAASASLDSVVENYDDVLVILVSDTANAYIDLRTLERRVDYARENARLQAQTLKVIQDRFDNGRAANLDLSQAANNLAQTEALIPPLEAGRRIAANRLSVLLGQPPSDLTGRLGATAEIPKPPPQVAVGVPADLLRRRPDVRRAERDLAAQSARIGVAASDFYPHISIGGTVGYESKNFSQLFQGNSLFGAVGPSFSWNVLNYGRIWQNVRLQDATFQRLAYVYQAAVLNADLEAENAIITYLKSQERVSALRRAVAEGKKAVATVDQLFVEGKVDFNRVFTIQAELVQIQDQLAASEGDVAKSLVAIYRALGGGWEIRLSDSELESLPPPPEAAPPPAPIPAPAPAPNPLPAPKVPGAPSPPKDTTAVAPARKALQVSAPRASLRGF